MSGEKSELPKETSNQSAPPTYSDAQTTYGYNQHQPQQNQPLMGQPNFQGQPMYPAQQGYVQYPGQQVVYGQPQTANVVVAYPGPPIPASQAPPDYFTQAIMVTICCFWPTGIFAIMRASDARSALSRGDLAAAQTYSRSAKFMVNVSIGVGILSIVLACVFIGVYISVIMNSMKYHDYND